MQLVDGTLLADLPEQIGRPLFLCATQKPHAKSTMRMPLIGLSWGRASEWLTPVR